MNILDMTFDQYLENPGDADLQALFAEADKIAARAELRDQAMQLKLQLMSLGRRYAEVKRQLKELE